MKQGAFFFWASDSIQLFPVTLIDYPWCAAPPSYGLVTEKLPYNMMWRKHTGAGWTGGELPAQVVTVTHAFAKNDPQVRLITFH